MQIRLNFRRIIGLVLVIILLTMQAPKTYAIFSPRLSKEAGDIKGHIFASRQINGSGTLADAWRKVDERNSELKAANQAYGTPGGYTLLLNTHKRIVIKSLLSSFADGFSLLIGKIAETGESITTCLRDDIFELQALQEEVLSETFKAALLSDDANSSVLWKDYQLLDNEIEKLKSSDKEVGYKSTKIWFPDGSQNFYLECPYGEFTQAFDELKAAFERMRANAKNKGAAGGGILEDSTIRKKAAKRAAEWAKNNIKVSFGGESGGNPQSLTNGLDLKGLVNEFVINTEMAKNLVNSLQPAFKVDATDFENIRRAYQQVENQKKLSYNQMETALKFNLQLNNVGEQSLKMIENKLLLINTEIQRAFANNSEASIKKFCEEVNIVVKTQCKNKTGGEAPSCQQ